jgi:hypothetical protein
MPVDYTIASRNALANTPTDFTNMLAQYQMMGARAQQQELARMQMDEYERARREDEMVRQYYARPGMDPLSRSALTGLASVSPSTFVKSLSPYSSALAERAREDVLYGTQRREEELQPYKIQEAIGKGRKASSEATAEDLKSAQRLVAPAYMARDPETFASRYAQVYSDLPERVRDRLGPRPSMQDIEAFLSTPEEILQARKPIPGMKTGELIATPTGRPNEPAIAVEPRYMAPANALAPQGNANNMGRLVTDMGPQQIDPVIQKELFRQEQLKQLPPGPAREKAGARMDIGDNLDVIDEQLTGLAKAGGIPRAGATSSENWKAAFRKSQTGQALGNLSDSEVNARLAALRTASTVLKAQLRKGLEMGVTQMDAVKESEKLDQALLNPDSVKALSQGYASIDVLKKLLGGGSAPMAQPATRGRAGEAPKSNVGDFFK